MISRNFCFPFSAPHMPLARKRRTGHRKCWSESVVQIGWDRHRFGLHTAFEKLHRAGRQKTVRFFCRQAPPGKRTAYRRVVPGIGSRSDRRGSAYDLREDWFENVWVQWRISRYLPPSCIIFYQIVLFVLFWKPAVLKIPSMRAVVAMRRHAQTKTPERTGFLYTALI